jgi:hypothetical protein
MKLSAEQDKVVVALYDGYSDPKKIAQQTCLSVQGVRKVLSELQELGLCEGPASLLDDCAKALKEMDENLSPVDSGYAEHVLLIASALTTANEKFLAAELGYDKEFVLTVGGRLRSAGIWVKNKLDEEVRKSWTDENGGIAFWVDGAVACGNLKVVSGKGKDRKYQMTESGLKKGADLIKKTNNTDTTT